MSTMFMVTSNSREYLRDLQRIPGAMQKVTAATLTDTAQAVSTRSVRNLKRDMIVRVPYTTKSVRTYKASPGRPIERQDAVSGTISPYLPIHDEGGKIRARRKRIAVPTNRVRGADRRRKVSKRYKIGEMPKAFVLRPASPEKILRRPALFVRRGKKLEKVRDLGAKTYTLRATHWHGEAVRKYGNWDYMAQVFRRQAMRYLPGR